MALLQKERKINFQLLIVAFVAVGMAKSEAPPSISYTCNDDGVATLEIVNFTNYRIVSGPQNQGSMCSPKAKTFTTCTDINDKKHMFVVYSENTFIGHGSTIYELVCKDENPSVVWRTLTAFPVKSLGKTVTESVIIPHSFNLVLKNTQNNPVTADMEINIGDELKLQMIGSPSGVVISPMTCTAASVLGDKLTNITIWKYDGKMGATEKCLNKEASIISTKTWEKIDNNKHDIQVLLYAFRFVQSANVVIECAANVCPSDNADSCKQDCVTNHSKRRRRRGAATDEVRNEHIRSSSISFSISSEEFNAYSSSGLVSGSMKFVIFSLTCLYVYTT